MNLPDAGTSGIPAAPKPPPPPTKGLPKPNIQPTTTRG